MQPAERRFRQRQPAGRLKLEFCLFNWFGRPKKPQPATVSDFAISGLTMFSDVKLKPGQRLLLNLASHDHRLQAVPARIIRGDEHTGHYRYAVQFTLGDMPPGASRAAYSVLHQLEQGLKRPQAA